MRVLPMVVAVVVTAGGATAQDDRLGPQASIYRSTLRARRGSRNVRDRHG